MALDATSNGTLATSHAALQDAMPAAHRTFLRTLPNSVSLGDFFFCHAGVRPGVALDRQGPNDLIWIRSAFANHPALYEKVIVHGHTPHHEPAR